MATQVVAHTGAGRRSAASRAPRAEVTTKMPLWSPRHLLVVVVLNLVGTVLIAVGWYQGSDEAHVDEQLNWLNVGIAGLIVVGATNALHVLRARRMVTCMQATLLAQVPRFTAKPVRAREVRSVSDLSPAGVVVAAEGMSHYHRPGCALAAGKSTRRGSAAEFEQAGLIRCEVCEP